MKREGNSSTLTEKQKAFARGVFKGLSQREAYKRAYDCAKKKDETVDALASRLLSNVKVQKYLEELNKEAESPLVLTKQQRMEWLSKVVTTPIGEIDNTSELCQESCIDDSGMKFKMPSKIAAIAELNKMDGAYTPQKMEVDAGENFMSLLAALPYDPPVKSGEK